MPSNVPMESMGFLLGTISLMERRALPLFWDCYLFNRTAKVLLIAVEVLNQVSHHLRSRDTLGFDDKIQPMSVSAAAYLYDGPPPRCIQLLERRGETGGRQHKRGRSAQRSGRRATLV